MHGNTVFLKLLKEMNWIFFQMNANEGTEFRILRMQTITDSVMKGNILFPINNDLYSYL